MFRARPEGPGCDRVKGVVAKIDLSSLSVVTSCRFPCGVSALYCDGENVYAGGRNGKVWKCSGCSSSCGSR